MTHRGRKRAKVAGCEISEILTPGSVEVLSVDIFDRKVTKRRAIERVSFNIPSPIDSTPTPTDSFSTGDTEDVTSHVQNPKGPSRSASVSAFSFPACATFDH